MASLPAYGMESRAQRSFALCAFRFRKEGRMTGPSESDHVREFARSDRFDRLLEDAIGAGMLIGVIALFGLALLVVLK
jgi:hypothetical protein